MTKQDYLKKLYQNAEELYSQKGKEKQAIAAYQAYLQEAPGHAAAWTELGTLLREQGSIPDALASFQQAIELDPDTHRFWNNKAMLLSSLNNSQKEHFTHLHHLKEDCLKLFPDINTLREELVVCYEKIIALGASAYRSSAMTSRARLLGEMGRHSEAITAYQQLAEMESNPRKKSRHMFSIALQYEELEEWEKALEYVERRMADGDSIIFTHKARILQKAGREAEAQDTYEQFLTAVDEKIAATGDAAYYFQKASVLKDLGRFKEVRECIQSLQASGKRLTSSQKARIKEILANIETRK